ncbi:hypothetical protein BD324DRAFT_651408 [Kockovaella imperatae]|uniref:Zn(2)-C6 fungal-type domain-containing protein n=1 Tax=Kockovaella imperatae TaxID=4999 RepID=A0A1Y1UHH9_9TREE|nr:hypothetical protein BD324DRAFT_651408 [Kockovaella imperatae]ORX36934.1 hypothetical protein BD324DRAFT_651408 [Kockovaella imperatae]
MPGSAARRPWSSPSPENGDGYQSGPSGTGRKSKSLNCAECRRLKIKCDRQVPCNGCIKRGYPELCPDRALGGLKGLIRERDDLASRVHELESMLGNTAAPHLAFHTTSPANPTSGGLSPVTVRKSSAYLNDVTAMDALASVASRSPHVIGPDPIEAPHTLSSAESSQRNELGTLQVDADRSTYAGPAAGMQWLRDDTLRSDHAHIPAYPIDRDTADFAALANLPNATSQPYSKLFSQLPNMEEARILSQSYFRRIAWIGTPITSADFDQILESVYIERRSSSAQRSPLAYQQLGLVSAVLAFGMIMNMEIPPLSSQAVTYLSIAQSCLLSGKFMLSTTTTGLQTLSLICTALPYVDLSSRWDYAWQLLGTANRMMQAMGLHRDGSLWGLDAQEVDRRRRLFWYIYGSDVFMSATWDRMTGLSPDYLDTMLPESFSQPTVTFDYIHSRLASLAKEHAFGRDTPRLCSSMDKNNKYLAPIDETPLRLRCRASMRVTVSKYGSQREADEASPAPIATDVALLFQQHYLALKISSTIYALLRPYFVTALRAAPADPTHSPFAAPFLAAVERLIMIIATLQSLYSLSPLVSARHWYFWSDGLSAGACLASICVIAPGCPVAPLAMESLEGFLILLPNFRDSIPCEGSKHDVEWLTVLHDNARAAMESYRSRPPSKATHEHVAHETASEWSAQTAAWMYRLHKMSNSQEFEEYSSSRKGSMDTGSLMDQNWWESLVSGQEAPNVPDVLPRSTDWLHQVLQMPDTDESQGFREGLDLEQGGKSLESQRPW